MIKQAWIYAKIWDTVDTQVVGRNEFNPISEACVAEVFLLHEACFLITSGLPGGW